jgi:hypothetical protein
LNAKAGGGVAIDRQCQGVAAGLLIGRNVSELRQRFQLAKDLGSPLVEFVQIRVLQRILVKCPCRPPTNVDVLRRLQEQRSPLHFHELRPQPVDDLHRARAALIAQLQGYKEPTIVLRLLAGCAGIQADRRHIRVGRHDRGQRQLVALHLGKRHVLCGLRGTENEAGVLLWKKSLWNDHEQIDRKRDRADEHQERDEAMAQRHVEAAPVTREHHVKSPLRKEVQTAVAHAGLRTQKARAHDRRQRHRDKSRNQNGHRHGDGKLAKHAADDAPHQQQRNEHRDQRQADRHDGEADLA